MFVLILRNARKISSSIEQVVRALINSTKVMEGKANLFEINLGTWKK
jgi:hypothetical protein